MSFSLFQRSLAGAMSDAAGEDADKNTIIVDLETTVTSDLEYAAAEIQKCLAARRQGVPLELTRRRLEHIGETLEHPAVQKPFPLDHLELYQNYLGRTEPPVELKERHAQLSGQVQGMIATHPLASHRSGDRAPSMSPRAVPAPSEGRLPSIVKVPLRRRRQTAAVLFFNFFTGPLIVLGLLAIFWAWVPYSEVLLPLYFLWIVVDNMTRRMPAPKRVRPWWRNNVVFRLFRDFFPFLHIRASAADEFDPKGNYLFCYHPHGVMAAGGFLLASAASGVDKLLPGLRISVQTLSVNFWMPVIREHITALGVGDASKKSLINALTAGPGACAALVTGGAKESMFAHPFQSHVVLKQRMGFVKIAITTGASLVPMWGFGENNLYENLAVSSSRIRRWQRRIQRVLSFAPVLVAGRGVFTYTGGLLPFRRPVTVVIGAPIAVEKIEKPTDEQIHEKHREYCEAVKELFNLYRDIYDPKARDIEFV
eukprot:TRINITY_DN12342_c0_g1_i1.p1 TRINITY_DN12342_c0_g1~~TRINITY_DN12342_c0_g1_i1.p1  ORF type:complete len:524 (+),score=180.40 TRINITY_DN12342_c0_g1_i1:130-1572(+)